MQGRCVLLLLVLVASAAANPINREEDASVVKPPTASVTQLTADAEITPEAGEETVDPAAAPGESAVAPRESAVAPRESAVAAAPEEPPVAATPEEPAIAATPEEPAVAETPEEPAVAAVPKESGSIAEDETDIAEEAPGKITVEDVREDTPNEETPVEEGAENNEETVVEKNAKESAVTSAPEEAEELTTEAEVVVAAVAKETAVAEEIVEEVTGRSESIDEDEPVTATTETNALVETEQEDDVVAINVAEADERIQQDSIPEVSVDLVAKDVSTNSQDSDITFQQDIASETVEKEGAAETTATIETIDEIDTTEVPAEETTTSTVDNEKNIDSVFRSETLDDTETAEEELNVGTTQISKLESETETVVRGDQETEEEIVTDSPVERIDSATDVLHEDATTEREIGEEQTSSPEDATADLITSQSIIQETKAVDVPTDSASVPQEDQEATTVENVEIARSEIDTYENAANIEIVEISETKVTDDGIASKDSSLIKIVEITETPESVAEDVEPSTLTEAPLRADEPEILDDENDETLDTTESTTEQEQQLIGDSNGDPQEIVTRSQDSSEAEEEKGEEVEDPQTASPITSKVQTVNIDDEYWLKMQSADITNKLQEVVVTEPEAIATESLAAVEAAAPSAQPVAVPELAEPAIKQEQAEIVADESSSETTGDESLIEPDQGSPAEPDQDPAIKSEQESPVEKEQEAPVKVEQDSSVESDQGVPVRSEQESAVEQEALVTQEQEVPIEVEQKSPVETSQSSSSAEKVLSEHSDVESTFGKVAQKYGLRPLSSVNKEIQDTKDKLDIVAVEDVGVPKEDPIYQGNESKSDFQETNALQRKLSLGDKVVRFVRSYW